MNIMQIDIFFLQACIYKYFTNLLCVVEIIEKLGFMIYLHINVSFFLPLEHFVFISNVLIPKSLH